MGDSDFMAGSSPPAGVFSEVSFFGEGCTEGTNSFTAAKLRRAEGESVISVRECDEGIVAKSWEAREEEAGGEV